MCVCRVVVVVVVVGVLLLLLFVWVGAQICSFAHALLRSGGICLGLWVLGSSFLVVWVGLQVF